MLEMALVKRGHPSRGGIALHKKVQEFPMVVEGKREKEPGSSSGGILNLSNLGNRLLLRTGGRFDGRAR